MSFLPSLSAGHFALAGLACAAGPILIHLLNRRRFRIVEWAAMDFLREALQRNRKLLQLRDILLLVLRTAAVLLFGLALARPYLSVNEEKFDGSQPLHAVLVVDNSLSMGYQPESAAGTLLERAKERAREFIEKLPKGSRMSIVPLCGSQHGYSPDPFDTKETALEALGKIELVDRSASAQRALNEARKVCEANPDLAKRVVFIGDQQRDNWRDVAGAESFRGLPSVQVVNVAPSDWENSWISDLRIQDGLADVETPTTFVVEVQHRGLAARNGVQVSLLVDGTEVASKTVTLNPAEGARQVTFEHLFSSFQPEPGKPVFVPVKATITSDSLPEDDERHLVAPVVAALPVVFVDQYGAEEEDAVKNRLGETRHLRKLLAPVASRGEAQSQLVKIRHIRLAELNQDVLTDARLVVLAGLESPGEAVPLLRDYVKQGGQLVIAAGARFDPDTWNSLAWLDGQGILPAPLKKEMVGGTPEEAGDRLAPFFISFDSMSADEYFHLPDSSENELRDLYSEPFFFKAVEVDLGDEVLGGLRKSEGTRLVAARQLATEIESRRAALAEREKRGDLSDAERAAVRDVEEQWRQLHPAWLLWSDASRSGRTITLPTGDAAQQQQQLDAEVESLLPRPLVRFGSETGLPFLIERTVGGGKVMFASSGLLSNWNTLPKTNTMFLFDRILRGMIQTTLPRRNFSPQERIPFPLLGEDRQLTVQLQRPGREHSPETLDIGFLGQEQRGVTIANALVRGAYHVTALGVVENDATNSSATAGREVPVWDQPLAVNGDAGESELTLLPQERFEELTAGANVRWVNPGEEINLAGAQISGQNSWWYLALFVLIFLLAELGILAWPAW